MNFKCSACAKDFNNDTHQYSMNVVLGDVNHLLLHCKFCHIPHFLAREMSLNDKKCFGILTSYSGDFRRASTTHQFRSSLHHPLKFCLCYCSRQNCYCYYY